MQTLFRFLGIILFVYILSKIDIAELKDALKETNLFYYLTGILFLIFWFLVRTLKWKKLIDSIGVNISTKNLCKIMAKGIFLGVVTPGKLGEFWRAKYLAEFGAVSAGRAFYTAFMDRLIDMLVIGLVAIPGLLIIYLRFNVEARWQLYVFGFCLFIFSFFIFLKKLGLQRASKMFIGLLIPAPWKEQINVFSAEFDAGFRSLKLRLFLETLAYGLLYYLIAVVVYYFIALSLDISLPFWYLFLAVAVVWLILALPISFFGLGARELGFIYFFSIFGVSAPLAVAFSLLAMLANILLGLPGAVLFLRRK